VDLGKLLEMEQEMSRSLSRLAGVYEMLTQCLSARICSERAAFPALCLDASQLLEDTRKVKAYVEERHARQTRGELSEWFRRDRARLYFPLRGFDEFTKACLAWNDRHPQERVPIAQSGFQGPR
jgi:hypothetical protein